jgi:hypothetical protein
MVQIFKLAMQPEMLLAVTVPLPVQLFGLVLGLRGWEAGVNVLGDGLVPTAPPCLNA